MRVTPSAFVKPFVERQKNDTANAEVICETVRPPGSADRASATQHAPNGGGDGAQSGPGLFDRGALTGPSGDGTACGFGTGLSACGLPAPVLREAAHRSPAAKSSKLAYSCTLWLIASRQGTQRPARNSLVPAASRVPPAITTPYCARASWTLSSQSSTSSSTSAGSRSNGSP